MKTNEIRDLITEQRNANKTYNDLIDSIKSDRTLSDIGRNEKIAEARKKHNEAMANRGMKVANSLISFKKGYKKGIDLADPKLTNALLIIGTMGKDTPVSVLNEATEHFRDNQEALKTISNAIKGQGGSYSAIDNFIIDDQVIDDAIIEAQKGFENPSSLSPIGIAMSHIENVANATTIEESIQPSSVPLVF